jgi:hypothetical protein
MLSLREIENFVFRAEIESIKEECGFETDEEALAFYEKYKNEIRPKIFGKIEKLKKTVHNCSECDYCYSNETFRGNEHICVNGESEYVGEFIDGYGLAEEDYDCVVIDGKHRREIDEDEELEELEEDEEL